MNKDHNTEIVQYRFSGRRTISIEVSIEVKMALRQFERIEDKLRKEKNRHIIYSATVGDMAAVPLDEEMKDIAALIARKESNSPLNKAINNLKPLLRRRFLLHYQHELNYEQIAKIEKVDPSSIGKSVRRAMKIIKEHMVK